MQQPDKNTFDQALEDLQHLNDTPPGVDRDPSKTWDRIEAELEPADQRRPAILWWRLAGVIVLAVGVTFWIVSRQSSPTEMAQNGEHSPERIAQADSISLEPTPNESPTLRNPPPPPPDLMSQQQERKEELAALGFVQKEQGVKTSFFDQNLGKKLQSSLANVPIQPGYFSGTGATIEPPSVEEYASIEERGYVKATEEPLSTFSIDVDKAAYANVRRYLLQWGEMPPPGAVRTEEMVNYFDYNYRVPGPNSRHPFHVETEVAVCPWDKSHQLVHIGIQGRDLPRTDLPRNNLVFLVDVSGSMSDPNKLPLLKESFALLVEQLNDRDRVSMVVYAGAAGVVLEPTPGSEREVILQALNRLEAGGSTAGGAGIELAYRLAEKNFDRDGNNRVILATDGDFNVGVSSSSGLEQLIEKKRESGIFLTVLGLGTGNYKDARMETLADKGNGNFFYIDQLNEARKVFVEELNGTLFTIAKDVKIQVEFNPQAVESYRLIGYENRALQNEDFENDKVDAGELGAGHTVTALYEVVPAGTGDLKSESLRYQKPMLSEEGKYSGEMLEVRVRYKQPQGSESTLITHRVQNQARNLVMTTNNFRWSAAVAAFSLVLRDSEYKGGTTFAGIRQLAESALGNDPYGYRSEFLNLVDRAESIQAQVSAQDQK